MLRLAAFLIIHENNFTFFTPVVMMISLICKSIIFLHSVCTKIQVHSTQIHFLTDCFLYFIHKFLFKNVCFFLSYEIICKLGFYFLLDGDPDFLSNFSFKLTRSLFTFLLKISIFLNDVLTKFGESVKRVLYRN